MNGQLLIQIMDLLAEAEISYAANGHSYEPEILEEMRILSDRVHELYDRLRDAYVVIETKKILEDLPIVEKGISKSKTETTVKQLFNQLDSNDYICPGGPLTNYVSYITLKAIFKKNDDIAIKEAIRRINIRT
jgi:hypothetical protein